MNPVMRRRLVGVLGLLASDHVGERAAAGLLATKLLKSAGVTWEQILAEEADRSVNDVPSGWRVDLALCQRHFQFLKPWGQDFVLNVSRLRVPSPKQQVTLGELADSLRARGRA